jgi:hypothetical protein
VGDDVVAGGLDPVDGTHADEGGAFVGPDWETGEGGAFGFAGGEEVEELPGEFGGRSAGELKLGTCPLEGVPEAGRFGGLEQVVQSVGFEGLDGMLVVGGDEDDERDGRCQAADDTEAVQAGHLDVEEDQVWVETLDGVECGLSVLGFADDLDVGFVGEEGADAFATEGFVVDEERADLHGSGSVGDSDSGLGATGGEVFQGELGVGAVEFAEAGAGV